MNAALFPEDLSSVSMGWFVATDNSRNLGPAPCTKNTGSPVSAIFCKQHSFKEKPTNLLAVQFPQNGALRALTAPTAVQCQLTFPVQLLLTKPNQV